MVLGPAMQDIANWLKAVGLGVHFQFASYLWWWLRSRPLMPTQIRRHSHCSCHHLVNSFMQVQVYPLRQCASVLGRRLLACHDHRLPPPDVIDGAGQAGRRW